MKEYTVKQCGNEWCLYNKEGTKVLGRHKSKDAAIGQEQAILAAKSSSYNIPDAEIFSVGKHNGDNYTQKDLDDMVAAFKELDFLPAIKIGHTTDGSAPAYGYLDNVYRNGDKLFADLIDLPKEVYDVILEKRYGRVSGEVYWNFQRAGKVYRRALGALALLGQAIPGVAKLKPLYEMFSIDESNDGELHAYSFDLLITENEDTALKFSKEHNGADDDNQEKEGHVMPEDLKTYEEKVKKLELLVEDLSSKMDATAGESKMYKEQLEAANARVKTIEEQRRKEYVEQKSESVKIPALKHIFKALYAQAVSSGEAKLKLYSVEDKKELDATSEEVVDQLVDWINEKSAKFFTEQGADDSKREAGSYDDAGAEVDTRIRKYRVDHKGVSYGEALTAVLAEDAALKSAYLSVQQ